MIAMIAGVALFANGMLLGAYLMRRWGRRDRSTWLRSPDILTHLRGTSVRHRVAIAAAQGTSRYWTTGAD